jgi:hypothetical protein
MFAHDPASSDACPRSAVGKRLWRPLVLTLPLVLAACSSGSSSLLDAPKATSQATSQANVQPAPASAKPAGSAAEQAQLKVALKNCPTTAEPTKSIGVAAMIEQAKAAPEATKAVPMSKAESDCLAARVKAQLIATSSQQVPAGSAANPIIPSKGSDLTIDFDSETAPISPKDQRAIADMLAKKGGSATKVRIFAGRGGNGNMFDQAVVAQKRANRVKELLPPAMVVSVEFDPQQIDDTVRIEFVDKT